MAGAVGSGPKDALQAGVVVCLYVLGMIAAGSLFLVYVRPCWLVVALCAAPMLA